MADLGPLEVFLCWESVALSAGVHVGTRAAKSALLLLVKSPKVEAWVRHVLLPCIPLLLGAVAAVVLDLYPAWLADYVIREKVEDPRVMFFCYGGMIGVFADYIHSRVSGTLKLKNAMSATTEEATTMAGKES